jgi:hypothetical protein
VVPHRDSGSFSVDGVLRLGCARTAGEEVVMDLTNFDQKARDKGWLEAVHTWAKEVKTTYEDALKHDRNLHARSVAVGGLGRINKLLRRVEMELQGFK